MNSPPSIRFGFRALLDAKAEFWLARFQGKGMKTLQGAAHSTRRCSTRSLRSPSMYRRKTGRENICFGLWNRFGTMQIFSRPVFRRYIDGERRLLVEHRLVEWAAP